MEFIQADISHLDFLLQLEMDNFKPERRADKKSIKNSILSKNQVVLIGTVNNEMVGSATLFLYKRSVRIYSVAVKNGKKGKGYGKAIVKHVLDFARMANYRKVTLEADYQDRPLLDFYLDLGFKKDKLLESYYGEGEHGIKMACELGTEQRSLVVTDYPTDFFDDMEEVICIRAQQYIEEPRYQEMKNIRVFNLCKSMKYQSVGYYVSLLGYARNHKVYPSTSTLRDFKCKTILKSIGDEVNDQIQDVFKDVKDKKIVIDNHFGFSGDGKYDEILDVINGLFESPISRFEFRKNIQWELYRVYSLQLNEVKDLEGIKDKAKHYFSQKKFRASALRNYQYDLAILVDDNELNPPSDKMALMNFRKSAEKYGFYVEFITKKDYKRLPEFDALFIRATTNVNDYTYDFSRYAYSEGLVVVDDPWSILGCSNKLYLYEKMKLNGVIMPDSWLLNKKSNYKNKIRQLKYPLILKQPDSAFSKGIHKVKNIEELKERLIELFKISEIVIAQQYIPSDFDWRIGVLNGKPLYACKYYMAKGHWQIYNWDAPTEHSEGDFETIPIQDAPEKVLHVAVKAAALMGDGLYGVDLKEIDGEVYLIEVNDNPNIDSSIEDAVLGEELYDEIMFDMLERIENSRNFERFISN